jgi:hypothetical protein
MVHTCNNCKKTFKIERDYKKHLARKTPCVQLQTEFPCNKCDRIYSNQYNLDKHKQICDDIPIPNTICTFCNHKYSSQYTLARHLDGYCEEKKEQERKQKEDLAFCAIKALQKQVKFMKKDKKENELLRAENDKLKKQAENDKLKKQKSAQQIKLNKIKQAAKINRKIDANDIVDNLINSSFDELENIINSVKNDEKELKELEQSYDLLSQEYDVLKAEFKQLSKLSIEIDKQSALN